MNSLTVSQYFGKWIDSIPAHSPYHSNAIELVKRVNALKEHLESIGVVFHINPTTNSIVSGETLGGFRPQTCPIGAPHSAHKVAMAVDIYDPKNEIDSALSNLQLDTLKEFGLYFEHKSATPHWSHWGTRSPRSGRRFFYP
jgi:hypothetical protein